MTLRVAIAGLGYFSRFHLRGWLRQDRVTVLGATDPDPARRDWAKGAFGIPVQDALAPLLSARPDILDIVAPPDAHAGLVRAASAPGRIVICQKPFCRSLAEARSVAEAARTAGATLVIHENFRFQPWHRTIKAVLQEGRLGIVHGARFDLRPGDGRGPDAYLDRQPAFRDMPRFLIRETGVHVIDLFRWYFGEVTGVYADLRRLNPVIAGEDAGFMALDHASGARTVFDGNRLGDHATDNPRRTMGEMRIEGDGGTLTLDGMGVVRFRPFGARDTAILPPVAVTDEDSFGGGCTEALIAHVAARADAPETLENRVEEYLPVLAIAEAAYRSAETGRKVILP